MPKADVTAYIFLAGVCLITDASKAELPLIEAALNEPIGLVDVVSVVGFAIESNKTPQECAAMLRHQFVH